jgi:TolA-binding protein
LAVDEGRLRAEVVHSLGSEWRFDLGPYSVNVTGTRFEVAWYPQQDQFDLKLEHGSVTVQAPVANAPIPLRAGQWLTIRSRSNEVTIRNLTTSSGSVPVLKSTPEPETSAVAPLQSPSAACPGTSLTELQPHKPETRLSWINELRLGHLEPIIADARQRGLESSFDSVSSEELSALADAARYTRRNDIARSALSAQRRRFPGSRAATDAAFLLGKLDEAERNAARALDQFNIYLQEAPSGRYAGEALGRKMAIVQKSAGSAAAKPIASQYLAKYPSGTYAEAARAIVNGT